MMPSSHLSMESKAYLAKTKSDISAARFKNFDLEQGGSSFQQSQSLQAPQPYLMYSPVVSSGQQHQNKPSTAASGYSDSSSISASRQFLSSYSSPSTEALGHNSVPSFNSNLHEEIYHQLTPVEKEEIRDYTNVYYFGQNAAPNSKIASFSQCDDPRGDYVLIKGDHIGYRFEILATLGKGSFGQVVECLDHLTGRNVAIKIIRNKKRFHEQALIEVKILEKICREDPEDKHNFVRIRDSFYFRNHLCIAFDLLSMNLYEFIKSNGFHGFSLSLIRRFTIQMVQCLVLLNKHHIIHCDLKPENVLLCSPNKSTIKVIDFGSSCYENERIYTYIQSRFYRSPEVVLGMEYGMPIDMWSLGCILAELYTGYPIFPAQDEQELLLCIMEILGVPHQDIILKSSRRRLFFHANLAPKIVPNSKNKMRKPGSKSFELVFKCTPSTERNQHLGFLDFLKRLITWDPLQRMTPQEALRHPWITGGTVEQVAPSLGNISLSTPPAASVADQQHVARQIQKTSYTNSNSQRRKSFFPPLGSGRVVNGGQHGKSSETTRLLGNPSQQQQAEKGGMIGMPSFATAINHRSQRQQPLIAEDSASKSARNLSGGWSSLSLFQGGISKIAHGLGFKPAQQSVNSYGGSSFDTARGDEEEGGMRRRK